MQAAAGPGENNSAKTYFEAALIFSSTNLYNYSDGKYSDPCMSRPLRAIKTDDLYAEIYGKSYAAFINQYPQPATSQLYSPHNSATFTRYKITFRL